MAQNIVQIRNLPYLSNVSVLSNLRGNASALSLTGNLNIAGSITAKSLTLTDVNSTGQLSGASVVANTGDYQRLTTQYLNVTTDAVISNLLSVSRISSSAAGQPLYLDSDVFITGNLIASQQIEVNSANVTISNTIGVGVLMPTEAVDVVGSIHATGNALFDSNANIGGYGYFGGSLTVNGNTRLHSNLVVDHDATITGLLTISALATTGDLNANSNVNIAGALTANGVATLRNNVSILGALSANSVSLSGALLANGTATFSNVVTFQSNASVEGLASLANVTVSGGATISGNLAAAKYLQSNSTISNTTQFGGDAFDYVDVSNANVIVVTNRISRSLYGTVWLGNASSIAVNHGLNVSANVYSVATTFCDALPSDQLVTVSVTEKTANAFVISCVPYNSSDTASVDFSITQLAPLTANTIP